jgi:hypothetical protein
MNSDGSLSPDILASLNAGNPLIVTIEWLDFDIFASPNPDQSHMAGSNDQSCGGNPPPGFPLPTCTFTKYSEVLDMSVQPSLSATLTLESPVPEPGSLLLSFAGLALISFWITRTGQRV